jgi:hypothetical protein
MHSSAAGTSGKAGGSVTQRALREFAGLHHELTEVWVHVAPLPCQCFQSPSRGRLNRRHGCVLTSHRDLTVPKDSGEKCQVPSSSLCRSGAHVLVGGRERARLIRRACWHAQVAGVRVSLFQHSLAHGTPDAVFPNNWFTTHPAGEAAGGVEQPTLVLYPLKCPNRCAGHLVGSCACCMTESLVTACKRMPRTRQGWQIMHLLRAHVPGACLFRWSRHATASQVLSRWRRLCRHVGPCAGACLHAGLAISSQDMLRYLAGK